MQVLSEMEQAGNTYQEMLALVLKREPNNLPLLITCTGRYIGRDIERPSTLTLPWVQQMLQAGASKETIRQLLRHLCLTGQEWTSAEIYCKAFLNEPEAWEVFEDEESFLRVLLGIAKQAPNAVFEATYQIAFFFGCRQAPEKKDRYDSLINQEKAGVMIHDVIARAKKLEQEIIRAGQNNATLVLKEASYHLISIPRRIMFDLVIEWLDPADQVRIACQVLPWGYGAVLHGYVLCNGSVDHREVCGALIRAQDCLQQFPKEAGNWYRHVLYGASLARYPHFLPESILGTVMDAGWAICRLETWENPRYRRKDLQVQGWDSRGAVRIILKQNPDPKLEGSCLREGDEVLIPRDPEQGLTPIHTGDRLAIYSYNFLPATAKEPKG